MTPIPTTHRQKSIWNETMRTYEEVVETSHIAGERRLETEVWSMTVHIGIAIAFEYELDHGRSPYLFACRTKAGVLWSKLWLTLQRVMRSVQLVVLRQTEKALSKMAAPMNGLKVADKRNIYGHHDESCFFCGRLILVTVRCATHG